MVNAGTDTFSIRDIRYIFLTADMYFISRCVVEHRALKIQTQIVCLLNLRGGVPHNKAA